MTTQIKAGVIAANAITASELASSALSGGSFTGDVTFDTNTLVVDSTNNRVGVGVASPDYPLEIQGTGTVTLAYQRTGVSAKKWGFHSDNDNTYWQNITDNVLALTVSNTGNVGIGTSSNLAKLSISNNGAGGFEFTPDTTAFSVANSNYIASYDRSASAYRDIVFDLGGAESQSVRFKTGGNVGIGTSSPGAKLDIRMSDSNGTYGRGLDGNLNLENTNTNTEGGWLSISGYMGNATSRYTMGAITGGKQTTAADGDYGSYLSFWNTSGGAGGESNSGMYERMRIDSAGNIIVRTTTANSALSSIQALSAALQLNTPGVDDKGGHIFMTQLAAENTWMNIVQCHDDGATGVLFLIHGVRTIDQNRSYGALVRYAYSDTFNVISVNQQNTTIEYRVSGNALQYRFTSPGPYVVNLSVMAAG